jgi:hypothetical protein
MVTRIIAGDDLLQRNTPVSYRFYTTIYPAMIEIYWKNHKLTRELLS